MSSRRLSTEKLSLGQGSRRGPPGRDEAEAIAVQAIAHIAADDDRLGRFLALTGLEPDGLRAAAREPGFLASVLDHLAGHEPDLVAFAAEAGVAPERVAAARLVLSGPDRWND
ncbi:MAG TPA: DUF3572 domain-containing protein [Rhodoblastus sp.]|nr:DUF3572 domain-containing protein [Rhodoblastus sp.]